MDPKEFFLDKVKEKMGSLPSEHKPELSHK